MAQTRAMKDEVGDRWTCVAANKALVYSRSDSKVAVVVAVVVELPFDDDDDATEEEDS